MPGNKQNAILRTLATRCDEIETTPIPITVDISVIYAAASTYLDVTQQLLGTAHRQWQVLPVRGECLGSYLARLGPPPDIDDDDNADGEPSEHSRMASARTLMAQRVAVSIQHLATLLGGFVPRSTTGPRAEQTVRLVRYTWNALSSVAASKQDTDLKSFASDVYEQVQAQTRKSDRRRRSTQAEQCAARRRYWSECATERH